MDSRCTRRTTLAVPFALTLSFALPATAFATNDGEPTPTVRWQRKVFASDACPVELPASPRASIERWTAWAGAHGYRMDLDSEARVILLSSDRHRSVHRQTELVRKTLEAFDDVAPWVPPSLRTKNNGDVVSPRSGAHEEAAIVLFHLAHQDDLAAALEEMARTDSYLAPWVQTASAAPGFSLQAPLAGGWIEDPDIEEWRSSNELVNRLVHALTLARFGRLPHWLTEGLAWHIELEVTRSIYAFPHRAGFVGIGEHKGWQGTLKRLYAKRRDAALDIDELSAWGRGDDWDDTHAAISWGMVTYLAKHDPEALPTLASDLGLYHEMHGVITRADGTWESLPDYRVPADVQRSLILRHGSVGILGECMSFFQKGKRYRR